jgi:FMN-dependent NADH-azoreductase
MNMKLLHIDSSILGGQSASRKVSAAIVARLRQATPDLEVTYRDLATEPLAHLSGALLTVDAPQTPALLQDRAESQTVLDEFLAADIVVIGAPMYNFNISSQLKVWIDRIAVAGKTFRYTKKGPEGLAGAKRVIVALARGGFYDPGTPMAAFEHVESYLRILFGFLGVTKLEIIAANGLKVGPDQAQKSLEDALREAQALIAA